mmetsp:Transcript_40729/g.49411  ORF Transcript_40729/g.49411 Transcript_40729/m.49411 type:complete len:275 (+) Transcript_40729:40-864(+)|eukprot:CAMPEP_0197867570 /NCGR_PEP_ID=MMETSP1438-20131217/44827_1 /TAXON_ID=1461541 /ORGANISM="Pterosperma sp., Strain CCMP1384" /LENGTH=274 /DNA_ID=CAMNT_0043486229 /DNA_START=27 /DNA_END=851 /DNA_ORIENTATION=+
MPKKQVDHSVTAPRAVPWENRSWTFNSFHDPCTTRPRVKLISPSRHATEKFVSAPTQNPVKAPKTITISTADAPPGFELPLIGGSGKIAEKVQVCNFGVTAKVGTESVRNPDGYRTIKTPVDDADIRLTAAEKTVTDSRLVDQQAKGKALLEKRNKDASLYLQNVADESSDLLGPGNQGKGVYSDAHIGFDTHSQFKLGYYTNDFATTYGELGLRKGKGSVDVPSTAEATYDIVMKQALRQEKTKLNGLPLNDDNPFHQGKSKTQMLWVTRNLF